MTDTVWSDISHFQVPVTNAYPHQFLCIRSNDGDYLDTHFPQNFAWCRQAVAGGRMWGFMVYYFYRPGVDGARVLMGRVGRPGPAMTVMIDVESAGGQVTGNQSAAINHQHAELAAWLGTPRRVVGYGNVSDLNALWPQKPPGLRLVIAAYGSNPPYPGKFAHQFTDKQNTPPFGPSDFNSADGMTPADLQQMFGMAAPAAPPAPAAQEDDMALPTGVQLPQTIGKYVVVTWPVGTAKGFTAITDSTAPVVFGVQEYHTDPEGRYVPKSDLKLPASGREVWTFNTAKDCTGVELTLKSGSGATGLHVNPV